MRFRLGSFLNRFDIRTGKLVFLSGFIAVLTSYTLFATGLDEDGSVYLIEMIHNNSFRFLHESRKIFHIFYQFPAWIFIKFSPVKSIDLLVKVFSFGLVWIHLVSLIGCWFVLPKDKKTFCIFPAFWFFYRACCCFGYLNLSRFVCLQLGVDGGFCDSLLGSFQNRS